MKPRSFVIDATPETVMKYRETHAIVGVDVFRATSVIVTALACGLNNSPAAIERLRNYRPIILVTSAGTKLLSEARGARSIYVACLRNVIATAAQLIGAHDRIALIGAGTRGEARPEDQYTCARIGELLYSQGYAPESRRTEAELEDWRGVQVNSLRTSPSCDFLRSTGQQDDLEFVLSHIDDIDASAVFNGQQVSLMLPGAQRLLAEA